MDSVPHLFNKVISVSLSIAFFITNVVGAQTPNNDSRLQGSEASFWTERQKAVKAAREYAQLPGGEALSSFRAGQFAMPQGQTSKITQNILPDITGIEAKARQENATGIPNLLVKQGPSWLRTLPYNYGVMEEFYESPKKDSPIVVFIQDVHGHYEAQLNIANIINNIAEAQGTEDRNPKTEVRNLKTDGRSRSSVLGRHWS